MKQFTYFLTGILILLILIFTPVAIFNSLSWYQWYSKLKPLILVIDIDRHLNNGNLEELEKKVFKTLPSLIATSVVNIYNVENSKQKFIAKVYDEKYDVVELKKYIAKRKDQIFSIVYIDEKLKEVVQHTSCKTKSSKAKLTGNVRKISRDEVESLLKNHSFAVLNFEGGYEKFKSQPIALRTFLLDLNLIKVLDDKTQLHTVVVKLKKAVFERSCSVVYILPSEYLSFEDNLTLIANIINKAKINLRMETLSNFESRGSKIVLNFITVLLAVFFPVLLYKFAVEFLRGSSVYSIYFMINLLTIFLGAFLWGLNQRYEYISLQSSLHGIKVMFILPVLVVISVVFSREEWKNILNSCLRFKDMLLVLVIFLLLVYMILRTENVNKKLLLPFELQIRQLIETYILFRPRFKELIMQPLLFLSLALLKENQGFITTKLIFCLSIISLTSIINTFLHTHTPIWLCILRSVCSVIFGLVLGVVLITIRQKITYKQIRIV